MRVGILGGGLAGVSLQRFLLAESEILEKELRIGGLCRTFEDAGFRYDIGGHILFSKEEALLDFFRGVLGGNLRRCRRNNQVLYKGRYVKYPFENGFGVLPKDEVYDLLAGFLDNAHPAPTNFQEWIYHVFGDGFADNYLIPYNRKIWKTPLDEMALEWVQRVPRPPMREVLKAGLGFETEGYRHQLYFYYPESGGIQALIAAVSQGSPAVTTQYQVRRIERSGRGWSVSDGSRRKEYDRLVSTIPPQELLPCLEGVPEDVRRAADGLRHNSVRVVLLGVGNTSLMEKSAVYIPDASVVPHRVCFMGYFSPTNVPQGCSSAVAEVTAPKGHELYDVSDDGLTEKVVADLHRIGIIDKKDLVATAIRNVEYAYVVHDSAHRKNMERIKSYLRSVGIEVLGRFGEFEYINMDETVSRSMRLARQVNERKE